MEWQDAASGDEKLYPVLFIDSFDSLTKGVNIWK